MFKILSSTLCLLVCFFSTNSLEAIWSPPDTISSPASDEAQIGIDAAGNAIAIWREYDGTYTNIHSSILPKGGSWSSPVIISSAIGSNLQSYPQIAVDQTGNAVAVWEELNGSNSTVKAATLPFGGTWSSPIAISLPSTNSGQVPQIAINSSGYAVAVWQRHNGSYNITQASTFQFGGNWSTPVDVSSTLIDTYVPQIAVDNSGNAVAVWLNVTDQSIQSACLPYGGSWSYPINLSATGGSGEPQVAMNPSGYAVATWERFNGSYFAIQASTLQFGDSWSTPFDISTSGSDAFQSEVAIDLNGNIVVAWDQVSGNDILIQAAYLPFEGSWSIPATLSPTGAFSFDPAVAFDASGNAFAVWDRDNGYDVVIQAAILPFGGTWSAPSDLSAYGQSTIFPRIAVDPTGYAVVDWTNNTLSVVQSTEWVPAPIVTNVTPNFGSTSGGDSITITGTNFINVTAVNFGSTWASFAVISPTEIIAISPPGSAGTVDITISTTAGTSSITPNDQYTYQSPSFPPPTVANVHPNNSPATGGNPVRIIGANFVNVTQVNFGYTQALGFNVISPTLIIAIAPPGSPGTVDVTVVTSAGTSAINYRDRYTYH